MAPICVSAPHLRVGNSKRTIVNTIWKVRFAGFLWVPFRKRVFAILLKPTDRKRPLELSLIRCDIFPGISENKKIPLWSKLRGIASVRVWKSAKFCVDIVPSGAWEKCWSPRYRISRWWKPPETRPVPFESPHSQLSNGADLVSGNVHHIEIRPCFVTVLFAFADIAPSFGPTPLGMALPYRHIYLRIYRAYVIPYCAYIANTTYI